MPGWIYVIGAIALLIAIILSIKVNVIVSYNNTLAVSIRILFIKIRLYPKKDKIAKEPRKKKKKKKKEPIREDKKPEGSDEEKSPSVVKVVWEIRQTILALIEKCMGALHFRFARLHIEVGCEDAAKTALVYGTVTQSVAYLVETLDNISNVEIASSSSIMVQSNFISRKSKAEAKIILYIRIISAIKLLFSALKAYLIFKFKKEQLTEEQNGKNKSE